MIIMACHSTSDVGLTSRDEFQFVESPIDGFELQNVGTAAFINSSSQCDYYMY